MYSFIWAYYDDVIDDNYKWLNSLHGNCVALQILCISFISLNFKFNNTYKISSFYIYLIYNYQAINYNLWILFLNKTKGENITGET